MHKYSRQHPKENIVLNKASPSPNLRGAKTPNPRPKKTYDSEDSPRFTPLLSKKSLMMAENLPRPMERLLNRPQPKQTHTKEIMRELTFKPKINSKSKSIDRRLNSSLCSGDRLHKLHRIVKNSIFPKKLKLFHRPGTSKQS